MGRLACWFAGVSLVACLLLASRAIPPTVAAEASSDSDSQAPAFEAGSTQHFEVQIAPLLARHCLECHDSAAKEGGLDLSRKDAAFRGGDSGEAIVPGKVDESLLWDTVHSDAMPLDRPPLSDEEKDQLRQWIEAGAVWSGEVIDPTAFTRDQRVGHNWLRRLTLPEYIETVRSAVGVDIEAEARRLLPADVRADGFSNTAYNLGVDLHHVEAYSQLAQIIVSRMDEEAFVAAYAPCRELNDRCMRELIEGAGKWLLRGPLEEHEVDSFLRISQLVAEEGGDFSEAVHYTLEAMLQSPRFIYLIEDQRGEEETRPLSPYELASRMSYILWGAPPDRELMRAADAGELADRRNVAEQVERMLQDPRAIERSAQFIHEWLNLEQLSNLRPNAERFPAWDAALAADMRDETLEFFKHVAWEQDRPLADLMNAQVAFATPRLAEHYGLSPSQIVGELGLAGQTGPPQRVTEGLQALYTFEEGSGDAVRDRSGASQPLHLKITDVSAVRWSDAGLTLSKPTQIAAQEPPGRLIGAVRSSEEITLEAWITPENDSQSGPARIVTFSADPNGRNFTLGQDGDRFEVRLRTSATSANGEPSLRSPSKTASTQRVHVVYTRDNQGQAKFFVNGQERESREIEGNFSSWDSRFRLALGNELSGDRPWKGTLHLVGIYDRALASEEVQQNHAAGARPAAVGASLAAAPHSGRVQDDLQALYTFSEGKGETVRDTSGAGEPLDLKIADRGAVQWESGRLKVSGSTQIATDGPPKRLLEAVSKSKALTVEAWITPEKASQQGPARIVTLSSGIGQRNFTLGQEGSTYEMRLRTEKTDANGLPGVASSSESVKTQLAHVVYTRDDQGRAKLYLNGQEQAARDVGSDLSSWDGNFRLMLANESSNDRPWQGTYHLIGIYSRALSAEQVQQNFHAGARSAEATTALVAAPRGGRVEEDLQALYTFGEGNGDTVRDASGAGEPLDLKISDRGAVQWEAGRLKVTGSTRIATEKPAKRLVDAVQKSKALSVEAWITPEKSSQSGPARIVSLSSGIVHRNWTLGQEGNTYEMRLRTDKTDDNGLPGVASPRDSVKTQLTHVVYTRDPSGRAKLYLNGKEQAAGEGGRDLAKWDGSYHLMLANETTGDRPWQGTLHLVGIYSRALTAEQVQQNFDAGAQPEPRSTLVASPGRSSGMPSGLQALYKFDEGEGDRVRDTSGVGKPLDLKIADRGAVQWDRGQLTVKGSTRIATTEPPKRLIEAVRATDELTLEAWISPENTSQDGPARILTFSSGSSQRNFTLGQEGDRYDARMRTSWTDANGLPSLAGRGGAVQTQLTHLVYTRGATGTGMLYINGEEHTARDVPGYIDNWDDSFQLMLANESSQDRPWRGTYHQVAIYNRALSPDEIRSQGMGMARYDVASMPSRGGLLTQGSVLTVGGDEASMVARGLFVLHDLLYSAVGNPPPCADTTPVPTEPGMSQRAIAEARLSDSSCGGCHSKFEPLAFGLERFDGIGAYFEQDEHGNELREDGTIQFPGEEKPVSYKTSAELLDLLAESERVRMNMTRKVTQFALGRPLVEADAAQLEAIHRAAQDGGGTYASLIAAVVMSDLVQTTRTEAK